MAIAATKKRGMVVRMKNVNNGRFQPGNQFARGFGRPRGSKRMLRDVLAARLDVESFVITINEDIVKAGRGDFKASLRVASVLRRLLFSDGTDMPRFWNTREARLKRQK